MVQEEDEQNLELLDISKQILTLTMEVRALAEPSSDGNPPSASDRSGS